MRNAHLLFLRDNNREEHQQSGYEILIEGAANDKKKEPKRECKRVIP